MPFSILSWWVMFMPCVVSRDRKIFHKKKGMGFIQVHLYALFTQDDIGLVAWSIVFFLMQP